VFGRRCGTSNNFEAGVEMNSQSSSAVPINPAPRANCATAAANHPIVVNVRSARRRGFFLWLTCCVATGKSHCEKFQITAALSRGGVIALKLVIARLQQPVVNLLGEIENGVEYPCVSQTVCRLTEELRFTNNC